MYRIDLPLQAVADTFADTFAPKLLPIIKDYLNNTRSYTVEISGMPDVNVGVSKNTLTYRFLNQISDLNSLKGYLKMSPLKQISLIRSLKKIKYPDDLIFKKITKGRYIKYYKGAPTDIDHFHTVCYDIFVNNGFEDSENIPQFIKREFIQNTQLRICPYCGEEKIEPTAVTKKQIDHFLPKSKYPFLGFCFYNLIPSCIVCNNLEHKKENDPLFSAKGIKHAIINPYQFNPGWIRYHLHFNRAEAYNDDDFQIILGFKEQTLLDGYDEFFDISSRVARHRDVAGQDFRRLMKFKAEHFYTGMQIDAIWLKNAYDSTISIDPQYDRPEYILYHRLRRDIFEQLLQLRKPEEFYTRRSPVTKETLT